MAQEWYLMNPPHVVTSGFEDDALNDFGQDGFLEMLNSDFAYDVELYSSDLSVCTPIRAVIHNRTQDTKLKTMSRHMLVPIGTCKAGQYVKYKDRFWLIVSLVDDNKVYEKAILSICNQLMTWINADGQIIQRWAHVDSASQYNNGETNMKYYFVRSDQVMAYLPDDDESLMLDSGVRFIIDKRCKVYERSFDESIVKSTCNPVTVYDVTRRDSVLDDYQGSGLTAFLLTQTEQSEDDGYYVVDGKGYWLCKKPAEKPDTKPATCFIDHESDEVLIDLEPSVFTAKFYNEAGEEVEATPVWGVDCDFTSDLEIEYVGKSVMIATGRDDLRNKNFELNLSADGFEPAVLTVHITEFF